MMYVIITGSNSSYVIAPAVAACRWRRRFDGMVRLNCFNGLKGYRYPC